MFKVYVAAPLRLDEVNQMIAEKLERLGAEVFLPITLGIPEPDKAASLAKSLYEEMDQSDAVVLVVPFGLSVAAEVGYVVAHKRFRWSSEKPLIKFMSGGGGVKNEYMIDPYVDYHIESTDDLAKSVDELGMLVSWLMSQKRRSSSTTLIND